MNRKYSVTGNIEGFDVSYSFDSREAAEEFARKQRAYYGGSASLVIIDMRAVKYGGSPRIIDGLGVDSGNSSRQEPRGAESSGYQSEVPSSPSQGFEVFCVTCGAQTKVDHELRLHNVSGPSMFTSINNRKPFDRSYSVRIECYNCGQIRIGDDVWK